MESDRLAAGPARVAARAASPEDDREKWIKDLLERRLTAYHEDLANQVNNLKLQLVIAILCLIALRRKPSKDSIKIPGLGVEVPVRWTYLFLPLGGLYLWLYGGYLLDHLIQQRVFLWSLLDRIEEPIRGGKPSVLSYRLLLEDRSFMDVWFMRFECARMASPERSPAIDQFLLIGWLSVHGISHGLTLSLLASPSHRFADGRWLRLGVLVAAMVTLIGSQEEFFVAYPTWASVPIVLAMLAVVLVFSNPGLQTRLAEPRAT